jgi:hypothetical protein
MQPAPHLAAILNKEGIVQSRLFAEVSHLLRRGVRSEHQNHGGRQA